MADLKSVRVTCKSQFEKPWAKPISRLCRAFGCALITLGWNYSKEKYSGEMFF